MRKIIKKIIPERILLFGLDILHKIYYFYYSNIFKQLIVRENTSDKNVFRQIFITKDYNLSLKIKPRLIVDAGANVGYSSLWFSKKYPLAKIIAIEPESSNFEVLEKNTESYKNIIPIKAGIWHRKTNLGIINNKEEKWAFQIREEPMGGINTITIEEILKKNKLERIDILKIDIEGSEEKLFSANTGWLEKVDIIIIELHDWLIPNSSSSFYSAINKQDWNISKSGENLVLVRKSRNKYKQYMAKK